MKIRYSLRSLMAVVTVVCVVIAMDMGVVSLMIAASKQSIDSGDVTDMWWDDTGTRWTELIESIVS